MSRPVIAVVAFDRISPFHISVPCVVFGEPHPGVPDVELRVCAAEPGPLTTTAGFDLVVHHDLSALAEADTVIVPSWRDPAERAPAALCEALVAAQARGAQIVGLCLGAYVLADAGLLDGCRATTHWGFTADFARRFPAVEVDPDVLYVESGRVMTSAGTAAGIDCCLHLIRARHGAEAANRIARRLVVAPHRQGGQAQFIEQPVPATARDDRLGEVIAWMRARLDQSHSLDHLAARALMGRRTFTRRFRLHTGQTVGDWLASERLARAQQLLEGSEQSVERIAELAGFGTAATLRQRFQAAFGISPSVWRKAFKG
ncbi:helix-turn-helix domain-containing protein [Denitromonas iodatirespirans]|uniref:Helix-turn-helix domain-containing protein n=1 Tax=Denitromonas iodatirespirans TaxID=2795389 RepID=A0A944DC76_DENI1|nr:helix-turn-helix domain-containing protein [Denitromonas iodatirespirans]MBT0962361.1 helix-turn-helix domain-containing protein [Denitromonas iodatirespirans]